MPSRIGLAKSKKGVNLPDTRLSLSNLNIESYFLINIGAAVGQHYPLDRFDGSAPLAYSAAVTDYAFACALHGGAGTVRVAARD